nr:MAG TPA: hypothetical protein [Bacteriophage sp.]
MLVQLKLYHTISIHFTSRQIDVETILQVNLVLHHLLLM